MENTYFMDCQFHRGKVLCTRRRPKSSHLPHERTWEANVLALSFTLRNGMGNILDWLKLDLILAVSLLKCILLRQFCSPYSSCSAGLTGKNWFRLSAIEYADDRTDACTSCVWIVRSSPGVLKLDGWMTYCLHLASIQSRRSAPSPITWFERIRRDFCRFTTSCGHWHFRRLLTPVMSLSLWAAQKWHDFRAFSCKKRRDSLWWVIVAVAPSQIIIQDEPYKRANVTDVIVWDALFPKNGRHENHELRKLQNLSIWFTI